MNKVILLGRLTADPELRRTQSGISACRFTVACNRRFADKTTGERKVDFITCVAWRQTADFVSKYFSKGSLISLEGTLNTGSYQDKNYPDVTHYTTDVLVDNVEFAGSKNEGQHQHQSNNSPAPSSTSQQNNSVLADFEEILGGSDVPFI